MKKVRLGTLLLIVACSICVYLTYHYSTPDVSPELFISKCDRVLRSEDNPASLLSINQLKKAPFAVRDCFGFMSFGGRPMYVSPEERQFPIAYAVSAYESHQRLLRLMRLIYRPHNLYCIHLDSKASVEYEQVVKSLFSCYPSNIIVVPDNQRISVRWGYFSVLQSALLCIRLLLHHKTIKWRYMLNINEKEFPLRTNWELVSALIALNGSNMIEGLPGAKYSDRFPKATLSFNVTWTKGSFLIAARREFLQFSLTDSRALEILKAMKAEENVRKVQDELFFSTLAYSPELGAPGSCQRIYPSSSSDPRSWFLVRYVDWNMAYCQSKLAVHEICIFGVRDIPILVQQPHLFANKFLPTFEPVAYDCMERWLEMKLVAERSLQRLDPHFNTTLFANLYCSRDHI